MDFGYDFGKQICPNRNGEQVAQKEMDSEWKR